MRNLLKLPDDVLIAVLHNFILDSTVEDLIRLEIVCKRMRQLCLSRTCWIEALETLDNRPPFISSRSSLLALSPTDLRNEIIRAVKLDRSWKSRGGPSKTAEISIPNADPSLTKPSTILPLPEVDLIFATYMWNKVCCWSISQKRLVWKYVASQDEDTPSSERGDVKNISFACNVLDNSSTIRIALYYICGRSDGMRIIEVHELHAHTFDHTLIFKSSSIFGFGKDSIQVRLQNDYIIIKSTPDVYEEQRMLGLVIMNWKDSTFYHIKLKEEPYNLSLPFVVTQDIVFFISKEETRCYRIIGFRYRELLGSSSCSFNQWPSYAVEHPEGQGGVYSLSLPPLQNVPRLVSMHVVVSTWSRTPSTRLIITLNTSTTPERQRQAHVTVFDVSFSLQAQAADSSSCDSLGVFTVTSRTSPANIVFLHTPSTSMRALTKRVIVANQSGRDVEYTRGMTTCYIPFHESRDEDLDEGMRERIQLLELSCGQPAGLGRTTVKMDPLGRVVAYYSWTNCIVVVRFD